jgi:hypothetical protein
MVMASLKGISVGFCDLEKRLEKTTIATIKIAIYIRLLRFQPVFIPYSICNKTKPVYIIRDFPYQLAMMALTCPQ